MPKTAREEFIEEHPEADFEGYSVLNPIRHPAGWAIIPVPYWADPDKPKGSQWEAEQRALYDREEDWSREMLADFTAQLGIAAYSSFDPAVHVTDEMITIDDNRPLLIAIDFNLQWLNGLVCQIRGGKIYVIDEISLQPGTIDKWVTEFRNRYPGHPGGLRIYGDSNGHRRNVQTGKSEYDLIMLGLQGYASSVELRAPRAAPNPRDRVNSVNRRLRGHEGFAGVEIYSGCVELIQDMQEVVLRPDGKDVLKIYRDSDPYSARTHASDALGYLVFREFPVRNEALKLKAKVSQARPPLQYGKLFGEF
jgi:hypothetical protein